MPKPRKGDDAEAQVVYRLRVKHGDAPASFMADGKAVDLDEGEIFETTDRWTYLGLRELPFLEEVTG